MDIEAIRIQLIRRGLHLTDVARGTGIAYDRLVKVMNGYRQARPEEITALAEVLGLPEAAIAAPKRGAGGSQR